MEPFNVLKSQVVLLLRDDIDTSQICPHRFMLLRTKAEIGDKLFANLREADPDFPLNDARLRRRQILVVGNNFGCGSSREHAVWAIAGWPFRAVIGTTFGDIFRNSSVKNGLLLVELSQEQHRELVSALKEQPDLEITIDLPARRVGWLKTKVGIPIDDFSHTLLVQGHDELQYLLNMKETIGRYERDNLQFAARFRLADTRGRSASDGRI